MSVSTKFDVLAELQTLERELNTKFETTSDKKKETIKTSFSYLEYTIDINICILKTTIRNIIMSITDADEISSSVLIDVLKNTIILHSKQLSNYPVFITYIENNMVSMTCCYNIIVVCKLLQNIRERKFNDNIHHRVINNNDSNMPPITAEARIAIEQRLPQTRFARQLKKKPCEYIVGEIVGCKDRNNNWYLSEIMHIHNDATFQGYWYYINFKGWGLLNKNESTYNEWLSSESYRVRKYNPRNHHLKRYNTSKKNAVDE
jgi:hypothetical protein